MVNATAILTGRAMLVNVLLIPRLASSLGISCLATVLETVFAENVFATLLWHDIMAVFAKNVRYVDEKFILE